MPRPTHFTLTPALVAAHAGGQWLCIDASGIGRRWPLYAERPGAAYVARVAAEAYGGVAPLAQPPTHQAPPVLRVDIRGPIDECAGAPGPCEEWIDGNDAISERLCAAFAEGDVLLCVHSPGGNPAGAPEGIRRATEAKAANGRRCIVHTEGVCASLAMWWALSIADEMYATADAEAGSIGCRGVHVSVAGALAKEGLVPTFSAWPDDGKLAGVAELPLSEIGKARNDAKVSAIGEAFAAACIGGPVGQRLGLTMEKIVALHADTLSGAAAVGALIDGLATLEECAADMLSAAAAPTRAGENAMAIKAEGGGGPPPKDGDEAPESAKGSKPDGICGNCGSGNPVAHKFCAQCGKTMAAPPMEDPKDKEPDSDDAKRAAARAARAPSSPLAASVPALRAEVANLRTILDSVARKVGARTHAEIDGALDAMCRDAANAIRYRGERNEQRATNARRERMDLLAALYTQDPAGHPRGKLVVDVIETIAGKPVVTGTKAAPQWSDAPEGRTLENLRAYTRSTLVGSTTTEASPYAGPPLEASDADARARAAVPRALAAMGAPGVRAAVKGGVPQDEAAAIFAREFGGAS